MTITSLFRTFADARTAAEQQAVAGAHRVHWTIWGNPPRCGLAVCERCRQSLRIARTSQALFRLEGSALEPCRPPAVVASTAALPYAAGE